MRNDKDVPANQTETEDVDPEEMAQTALETAIETINAADDDDTVAQAQAENEAIAQFAEVIGEAVMAGLSESSIPTYAGALATEAPNATKTAIREDIDDAIEAAAKGDIDAESIHAYLNDTVAEIDAVRSTDAHQSCLYRWKFDDDEHGEYEIETGANAAASHYSWKSLRHAIFDTVDVWPGEPPSWLKAPVDWENFIGPFISERSNEVTSVGKRTLAVTDLQNHIHRSVAYPDIEYMVRHHGVRIDDDPEAGNPSEIWIRSQEVTAICDDNAVEPRAVQVELDARDHTVDRVNGVSEETYVNGDWVSYWVLDADFADPGRYEESPETPTERIDRMMTNDEEAAMVDDEGTEIGIINTIGEVGTDVDPEPVSDRGEVDE